MAVRFSKIRNSHIFKINFSGWKYTDTWKDGRGLRPVPLFPFQVHTSCSPMHLIIIAVPLESKFNVMRFGLCRFKLALICPFQLDIKFCSSFLDSFRSFLAGFGARMTDSLAHHYWSSYIALHYTLAAQKLQSN